MSNTWTKYRLGCGRSTFVCLSLELISRIVGSRSVVPKFIFCDRHMDLYRREPDSPSHVYLVDQTSRSGMYDGAGRTLEGVNGSCSKGLLMSSWSV